MGERELMKVRELKEAAHALFVRGRYAQCAETYARLLRLTPKDANVHVRHAESCRRAGDRQSAIASYRSAAALLLEQGCESRARGALRAALELDPKDALILSDLARLGPQAPSQEERPSTGVTGFFERPLAGNGHAPPPPPPSYVLRAAEESASPKPLPPMPTIAPVNLEAVRRAGGRPAPIPLGSAVGSGRVPPPVVQGRLLPQAPVPPRAAPPAARPAAAPAQAAGATRLPAPAALPADTSAQAPSMPARPELRRLGPNAVAFRVSPQARWVIIRSESPLELSRADSLPAFEAEPGEAAYAPGQGAQSSATVTH
jgi:tetratricopeptide (TPR) repeat protein